MQGVCRAEEQRGARALAAGCPGRQAYANTAKPSGYSPGHALGLSLPPWPPALLTGPYHSLIRSFAQHTRGLLRRASAALVSEQCPASATGSEKTCCDLTAPRKGQRTALTHCASPPRSHLQPVLLSASPHWPPPEGLRWLDTFSAWASSSHMTNWHPHHTPWHRSRPGRSLVLNSPCVQKGWFATGPPSNSVPVLQSPENGFPFLLSLPSASLELGGTGVII